MDGIVVPASIRGVLLSDDLTSFDGREGKASFLAPDPMKVLPRLPLADPADLRDLYLLPFDEIVQYLVELGRNLALDSNPYLQEALEQSYELADQTPALLEWQYRQFPTLFERDTIVEAAEATIGLPYLESWKSSRMTDGRIASIRALGSRAVHVVAGNSPLLAGITVLRNAITRSDAIIKAPSNDALTGFAIARTMADIAPGHPLTKHFSVLYWKGGSYEFEQQLYRPANLEKIIAWGGLASVKHIVKFIQPGLELITLDPKRSATIIGPGAFGNDETLRAVGQRLAADVGAWNQLACCAARVVFAVSGTHPEGLKRLEALAAYAYDAMLRLPAHISTAARRYDLELAQNIKSIRSSPDFYHIVGGRDGEGGFIVSQTPDPVDFYTMLSGRTANLIPIDDVSDAFAFMNSYTQTVGIYPDSLKAELRDILPFYGAQRLVNLGYANYGSSAGLPQDAIEPTRRMVRWIVDESCDESQVQPLWLA